MANIWFAVWFAGIVMFSFSWFLSDEALTNQKRYPAIILIWPLYPLWWWIKRLSSETKKPDEIVPGVEKPSLILARMVAASILQYPERVSYENDSLDNEKVKNYRDYVRTPLYHICKWSHPTNGTNVYFKSCIDRYGGFQYTIGFVLSFTKQKMSDDQAIIDRIYPEEAERKIIIDAWKEALRIKNERKKIAQEAERQMKAVGVIEAYFKGAQ